MKPKMELTRIVKMKNVAPELDLTYKAEGRGAYVCKVGECIANARKRKVFERAFRGAVDLRIYDELERLT